jgi:Transglycosylase SLT domain
MRRIPLIALVFCLSARIAVASWTPEPGLSPGDQCRAAIAAAERGHGIPPRLLAAIGRVESGRRDPVTGRWSPWPWTINAEGQGYFFATEAEAIATVRSLRARGVRSIDVGCMQVNLMHHPDAFANLDQAFEPATNADYAARFLVQLHDETHDWVTATADYHSSNPAEGTPYAEKVVSVWPEEQREASLMPTPTLPFNQAGTSLFSSVAAASPIRPPPRSAPPVGQFQRPSGPNTGHGLAYYRAMPIRMSMRAPMIPRVPFGFLAR